MIVDEAHNAKSGLSFEMFSRINPSCMVEYTATPADNSNVLYSVSAAELKAEQMIKLPIMLSEHRTWEQAVSASVLEREKLDDLAKKDKDYIHPWLSLLSPIFIISQISLATTSGWSSQVWAGSRFQ